MTQEIVNKFFEANPQQLLVISVDDQLFPHYNEANTYISQHYPKMTWGERKEIRREWIRPGMKPRFIMQKMTKKNGITHVYTVFRVDTGAPVKVGSRVSNRDYVACSIGTGFTVFETMNWFGRLDLIGKGESRFYHGKPGFYYAYLESTDQAR